MSDAASSGKVLTRDDAPFDPDALRDRYRAERDKRIRPDGNEQYLQIAGRFADFGDDPYIEAPIKRAPLTDEVEVVVIGGG
ncbi:MAG: monooxygenase, partial [Phenylobacterium sp.]|nr:monooxygenase [Phenylobacterium sp.]